MSVQGGYAYLQDVSGQDMGRIMVHASLAPGSALSIGGKEIEVDSVLPRDEFMSGRAFLPSSKPKPSAMNGAQQQQPPPPAPMKAEKAFHPPTMRPHIRPLPSKNRPPPPPPSIPDNDKEDNEEASSSTTTTRSAPATAAVHSAFKNPYRDSTVLQPRNRIEPTPRHDPHAPGAVVMKRPAESDVPRGRQVVDVVIDPLLSKHLREHQKDGVKFMYECVMGLRAFAGEGAILADEMGLGKTLQTITLLWTLLKQNPVYQAGPVVKKALIVCPVTLINNWQKEFRKWLGNERIGIYVADGKKNRLTDFTMGKSYSVMIIGYERLRTVQNELAKGSAIDIVIADEGHRLKTVQNKSALAIQSLNTTRRIILSGTPIQNDLSEFFAMVDFVNPGLLGTFKTFMKEFEGPIVRSRQPNAPSADVEKGEARSEELGQLTSMFILRRSADLLSKYLPPKTEYVVFCRPTAAQSSIYNLVLASPMFQSVLGSSSESALQLITVLKKLCNSPSLLNATSESSSSSSKEGSTSMVEALSETITPNAARRLVPGASGKIRVLDQLLHNIHSMTDEKVVLVSNYTSTLTMLSSLLSSLGLPFLRLDGTTPPKKRQALVDTFNRAPARDCFAFLLSAKAGGTGLNLVGASRLVLFDVDWNPATDLQAMARIHRDGQARPCRIYRLLLRGALEEKIWQRQVTKVGLAHSVVDQKANIAQFSREELRDLFRLDEGAACQTHELMGCGCDCAGMGVPVIPDRGDTVNADGDGDSDVDEVEEELPDIGTLIKASQLHAHSVNRNNHQHQQQHPQTKKKPNKATEMQSLMQYTHLDPALLSGPSPTTTTTTTTTDGEDEDEDPRKAIFQQHSLEHIRATFAAQMDDDVLMAMLQEDNPGVGFVFKRSN